MGVFKKILLAIPILILLIMSPNSSSMVLAQDNDEPAEGSIREQTTTQAEQAILQTYYRDQLERYRNQEKARQLAQEQLNQLNTLAALEEAVLATKQTMITRDQVLQTYFKLLRLKLIDTHGVSLAEKTTVIKELESLEANLEDHETEVGKVSDRFSLAASVNSYAQLAVRFEPIGSHATCLIVFGKMQVVYDKTVALMPELEAKANEQATDFELAKKQRALTEVKLLATSTKSSLEQAYDTTFVGKFGQEKVFEYGDYGRLTNNLQAVYAQISQMHEFIDEVMKL